jgi:hypothetical protein
LEKALAKSTSQYASIDQFDRNTSSLIIATLSGISPHHHHHHHHHLRGVESRFSQRHSPRPHGRPASFLSFLRIRSRIATKRAQSELLRNCHRTGPVSPVPDETKLGQSAHRPSARDGLDMQPCQRGKAPRLLSRAANTANTIRQHNRAHCPHLLSPWQIRQCSPSYAPPAVVVVGTKRVLNS